MSFAQLLPHDTRKPIHEHIVLGRLHCNFMAKDSIASVKIIFIPELPAEQPWLPGIQRDQFSKADANPFNFARIPKIDFRMKTSPVSHQHLEAVLAMHP